ncbi:phage/plasmid primase, P4 family [uncultured Lamprocystis sp.]|jgi:putative DNA primase/helicase|uniref:DNA primase family protein n=1 Tax=uncultured Lamprocystis sp. TaxID=543132 RepID=UPI0025E55D47|nr:phage/plasmid primase, P4 family [uncultured Lamprocystis sp.]
MTAAVSSILDSPPRGRKKPPDPKPAVPEQTHFDIATDWIATQGALAPVADEGRLWAYRETSGLWEAIPPERIHTDIGARFRSQNCKKYADYKAVAALVHDMTACPEYFAGAPIGCMTPDGFYAVRGSEFTVSPPSPELRQRCAMAVTPADTDTSRFDQFLDQSFRHDDLGTSIAQQRLLQEIVGAALVGTFYRYERAVLLHGKAQAGKSTVLRLIEALFPPQFVGSVSPFAWSDDYHAAALAGLRINLVGELPADKELPAAAFKLITGRDAVQGRHPFGRVFSFRPTCGHIFNSNDFITTRDQHPAFWRRWLCLDFANSVPDTDRDEDLGERIIREELPGVAWWGLEGARRLAARGGFTNSPAHHAVLKRWRQSSDAVAEFLADADAVRVDAAAVAVRGEAYEAFRAWCKDNGRQALAKRKFFSRIEGLGYVISQTSNGYWVIRGIGLVPTSMT